MEALGLFVIEFLAAVLELIFQLLHGLFRLRRRLRKENGKAPPPPAAPPPNRFVFRLGYVAAKLSSARTGARRNAGSTATRGER